MKHETVVAIVFSHIPTPSLSDFIDHHTVHLKINNLAKA